MTEEEQQLYDRVPQDGSAITNPELQRQLGWDRDEILEREKRAKEGLQKPPGHVLGAGLIA